MATSPHKHIWSFVALLLTAQLGLSQAPTINQVSPSIGFVGDTIAILGQQFGFGTTQNRVTLGDQPCEVLNATPNQITFLVPSGAQPGPIRVKNYSTGLLTQSDSSFIPLVQCVEPLAFTTFQVSSSNSNFSLGSVLTSGFLNSDLKPDIVSADGNQLSLFFNLAEPDIVLKDSLVAGPSFTLSDSVRSLQALNLDSDDATELIVGISNGFLIGDLQSPGTLDTVYAFRDSSSIYSDFIWTDWDEDGMVEVVGLDSANQRLAVFSASVGTTIGFTAPLYVNLGTTGLQWMLKGCFDSHGDPQLILGGAGKDSLLWLQNSHSGMNLLPTSFSYVIIPLGGQISGLGTAADIDGDEIDEVLIPSLISMNPGYLQLDWLATGWQSQAYSSGSTVRAIGLTDFDGDGRKDIWMQPVNSSLGLFFRKDTASMGEPAFGPQFTVGLPNGSQRILVEDWNGDQAVDLLASDEMGQPLFIFNQGRPYMKVKGIPTDEVCPNVGSIEIELFPINSTISGPGINLNSLFFSPESLQVGNISILHSFVNNTGCIRSTSFNLYVKPLPQLSFSVLDTGGNPAAFFCLDDNQIYNLTGSPSGSLFNPGRFFGPGVTFLGAGAGEFRVSGLPDSIVNSVEDDFLSQEFEIYYTYGPVGGCRDTISRLLTVNPLPEVGTQVDFDPSLTARQLCISSEQIFRVSTRFALNDPILLEWYGLGIQDSSQLDGTANFSFAWIADSVLASQLASSDPNERAISVPYRIQDTLTGCSAEENSFLIEIIPQPTHADFFVDPVKVCEASPVTIRSGLIDGPVIDTSEIKPLDWTWIPMGQDTSQGTSLTIFPQFPGQFFIKIRTRTTGNCITELDTFIQVLEVPTAAFTVEDVCEGVPIQVTNQSIGDSVLYTWFLDGNLIDSTESPLLNLASAGEYSLQLLVRNELCVDSISQNIASQPRLSLPNPKDGYQFAFDANNGDWISRGKAPSWSWGTDTQAPISQPSDNSFWQTGTNQPYKSLEDSWLISPCLDLRGLDRPMVVFDKWADMLNGADGAVLEVKSQAGWTALGEFLPPDRSPAINWYNAASLNVQPGAQTLTSIGWTGSDSLGWQTVRHSLDEFLGDSSVQFRIAFATSVNNPQKQGMGFDNFRVQNRQKDVLLETFVNDFEGQRGVDSDSIRTLVESYPRDLNLIQFHTAFPQPDPVFVDNPADHSARALFYATSLPGVGVIDGQRYQGPIELLEGAQISRLSLLDPIFTIQHTLDTATSNVQVKVESKVDLDSLETILLTGWLANSSENPAFGSDNDLYNFLPDAGGNYLYQAWEVGSQQIVSISYPPNLNSIPEDSLLVFSFIQNVNSKEIFQSEMVSMEALRATGIPSQEAISWQVWPNPTTGNVRIDLGMHLRRDGLLTIKDLSGREIKNIRLDRGVQNLHIDLSAFSKGYYWGIIRVPGQVFVPKGIRIF